MAAPFLTVHRKHALLCHRQERAATHMQRAWRLYARQITMDILDLMGALPCLGARSIISTMIHGQPPSPRLETLGAPPAACPY
eukprot:14072-Heterocapsa_arctica.AAC.1